MTKRIGGWWLAREALSPGEAIIRTWNANHTQGTKRAVGGRLFLTADRIVFLPHRLDVVLGGKRWFAKRSSVRAVRKKPRGDAKLAGGARDRLWIELEGGQDEFFVVNGLDEAIRDLANAVGAEGSAAGDVGEEPAEGMRPA